VVASTRAPATAGGNHHSADRAVREEIQMKQYLLSVYHAEDFRPSPELAV
jgi:hypothetical protein